MSKRLYSAPVFSKLNGITMAKLHGPALSIQGSFAALRPIYLAVQPGLTPLTVRFKFPGDPDYRFWQAVSSLPVEENTPREVAARYDWVLLGFVPRHLHFAIQVRYMGDQGFICTAEAKDFSGDPVAREFLLLSNT